MNWRPVAIAMLLLPFLPASIADPIAGEGTVEYLIVTTSDLEASFLPLAHWKTSIGIPTSVVKIDDILPSYEGRDDAESLFMFVTEMSQSNDLRYLLLGGDAEEVPVRYLQASASGFGLDDRYLSDLYYASPGTDWDANGNDIFGEPEDILAIGEANLTFPLIVGRIPASTPEEASTAVNRTISYERSPPPGNWTHRAILTSSLMERPNILDDPLTPEDEGFEPRADNGYLAIERLRSYLPYTMQLREAHDYDRYWGLNYTQENDTLALGTVPALITEGASVFTFAGQSFYDADVWDPPTAYSLAQWFDPFGTANGSLGFQDALSSQDIDDLDNGGMLPFAYISSCDSANFSDPTDSDLSDSVLAPNGGFIGMIGSTGISWRGEYSEEEGGFGNWYLLPEFWKRYFSTDMPGESLYRTKEAYLRSFFGRSGLAERVLANLYGYVFLGDPSLTTWSAPPREMDVSISPEDLHAGGEDLSITVLTGSGAPVYDARVCAFCLSTGESFVSSTDDRGSAVIPTDFSTDDPITVTAIKRGYLPSITDLSLLPQPPDLAVIPGTLSVRPDVPTESQDLVIEVEVGSSGGPYTGMLNVSLFEGSIGALPWPVPIASEEVRSPGVSNAKVRFTIVPVRTWSILSIAIYPVQAEIDILDNVLQLPIHINSGPVVVPAELTLEEDGEALFDLSDHIIDPDGPISDLDIAIEGGHPDWMELSTHHYLKVRPPENWSGLKEVVIAASDGYEAREGSFKVRVNPVNDPPVLRGLPGRIAAEVDSAFVQDLVPVDAEGDLVTLKLEGGPENLSIVGYALRLVPTENDIGTFDLGINVSDPHGSFTIYRVELEVVPAANRLYIDVPGVRLPDARAGKRYSFTFRLSGDLADGAIFSDNTTLFDIDPITGVIDFVPSRSQSGEHWVRITATSGNITAQRSFVIVVDSDEDGLWWMPYLLGAVAIALAGAIVAVYRWPGRKVGQYGLEE